MFNVFNLSHGDPFLEIGALGAVAGRINRSFWNCGEAVLSRCKHDDDVVAILGDNSH